MTVKSIVVIQARMTSTRLPGKVLLSLAGRPVLWHVLERAKRITGIDGVAVAIPDGSDQEPLSEFVNEQSDVTLVRGSEEDVLQRYIRAADMTGADIVVRITSDCPVIDPGVASAVLAACKSCGSYARTAFTSGVPLGLDVEAVPVALLRESAQHSPDAYECEHVTPYIWRRPDRFPAVLLDRQPDRRSWRLTLDAPEDYDMMTQLFARIPDADEPFGLAQIEKVITDYPELLSINADVSHTLHEKLPR